MKKPLASVEHTSRVGTLNKSLQRLKKTSVFVGIASGKKGDTRKDGAIPNSVLGYIHEKGSPAAGIPARPFLEPGVASAQEKISHSMGVAMKAALADDAKEVKSILRQTGQDAVSAVQIYMRNASFEPLKLETIRNRKYSRKTKSRRKEEETGVGTIKPLINTKDLLSHIDFYIEG